MKPATKPTLVDAVAFAKASPNLSPSKSTAPNPHGFFMRGACAKIGFSLPIEDFIMSKAKAAQKAAKIQQQAATKNKAVKARRQKGDTTSNKNMDAQEWKNAGKK